MTDVDGDALESLSQVLSTSRLLLAAGVLVVTWLGLRLLEWIVGRLQTRLARYRLLLLRLFPVVRMAVWIGVLWVVVARILEPPRETVLALAASVGLAVGLAAQDLVKNLIAGILILLEQPFQVGDMIRAGEHAGEVTSIGLRATRLRTFNDDVVTVPNAALTSEPVANANSGQLQEMVVIEFNLPAHVDVIEAKRLAAEAALASPYVWLGKPVAVTVEDVFERTFLTRLRIKAYVLDIRLERVFASDVVERLKRATQARGLIDEEVVVGLLREEARGTAH